MSDATKAALEEAINAHFAAENENVVVTGFVLHAVGTNLDPEAKGYTRFMSTCPDTQPTHVRMGLARMLVLDIDGTYMRMDPVDD